MGLDINIHSDSFCGHPASATPGTPLISLDQEGLVGVGLSKTMAEKLLTLFETGTFKELEELEEKTPTGVIEMMGLSGVGPKKIATLWKELEIDSLEKLKTACEENKVQIETQREEQ